MAIEKIDQDMCVGCGVCVIACAVDVIRMNKETKKPYIAYGEDCILCDMCTWHCPTKAITVTPEMVQRVTMAWR